MYIPAAGVYFRLKGCLSQHVLFSRDHKEPNVGHWKGEQQNDQLFTLIHGTAKNGHPGLYAIKSKETAKVLLSRTHMEPRVGHVEGDGKYDDNWFTFEQGQGEYKDAFRIICPATKTALFSRIRYDPQVGCIDSSKVYDDQYFAFILEDMIIERIEYDCNDLEITDLPPEVVAEGIFPNNTDETLPFSSAFKKTVTETSTFKYKYGFSLTVGTQFSTSIPFIASEKEVKLTSKHTIKWTDGKKTVSKKEYEGTFKGKIPKRSKILAKATVQQANLVVPYTMHLYSKANNIRVTTSGKWEGISTWLLTCQYNEVPL